jgi:Protein of unknown function (DUF1071)
MKNLPHTWVTVKYKKDAFDIRLSNDINGISEIRPIDSEINIASMLNTDAIKSIQEGVAEINNVKYLKEDVMHYKDLRQINVSQHIEKKNGLSYLSWSWALDQLLQLDDSATWEYLEPKRFGESLMVFCKVTAFGKSRTAQLPVMDFRNQAIPNPNAYQVNTAMQRCLAKAISLHGIGLYIYAGEDLPILNESATSKVVTHENDKAVKN